MSHECIKTGCVCYVEEYREWVFGDAHLVGEVLVIRVSRRSWSPPRDMKHFTIKRVDYWPDRVDKTVPYPMLLSTKYENHGYEGIPV